jgi:hypothetical protein
VMALAEEPGKAVARLGGNDGQRHRDGVEAERGRSLDQCSFEVCGAQKSRSA